MDIAKSAAKRIYVCAGSFAERLVVAAARDGLSVYGGLDCVMWKYGSVNRVIVAPPRPGYALETDGLQAGVTFEDLEFDAPAAVNPGESSIAVFANKSSAVAFRRVTIVADVAADGAVGAPGGPNPDGGASADASNWYGTRPNFLELNGINAGDAGGAPTTTCTCTDRSSTTGGQGGSPLNVSPPSPGQPAYGDAGAGAAGINGAVCGNGGSPIANGGDAPDAAADMPSTSLGVLSATGWTPGGGVAGAAGKPGQGGGGGGNGRLSSGAGGGGACGGCGGAGGKPGSGGGSSIALLSYQSSVTLIGCTLTSKAAGNGGPGGSGEQGQNGGVMGGNGTFGGCQGGAGGAGAGGSGAQGGAGGLSLGIAYAGLAPTIDGVLVVQAVSQGGITLGNAGVGGAGGFKGAAATNGTGPAGADGAPGQNGIAMAVRQLP
jgi:hypothetical protein